MYEKINLLYSAWFTLLQQIKQILTGRPTCDLRYIKELELRDTEIHTLGLGGMMVKIYQPIEGFLDPFPLPLIYLHGQDCFMEETFGVM